MPKAAKAKAPLFTLHVFSDATGSLASHLTHSVLTQFPEERFRFSYHLFIRSAEDLDKALDTVRGPGHLVLHRLLRPEVKEHLRNLCVKKNLPEYDLTGGLKDFLETHSGLKPFNDPDRLHPVDEQYFRRIEAMEFTAQHDDNRRLESIQEADIVIVGLSRVSKSPTSTWLGSLGYKTANVAIAPETGFPKELDGLSGRVAAFTTRPRELWRIRRRRFEQFSKKIDHKDLEQLPYYDLRSIVSEVSWAEKEFRSRGYPIFDISGQTVEEVATRVITTLKPGVDDPLQPE